MKNIKQIMIFALVCLLLFSCSKESSSSSESNVAVKVDSLVETAKDDVSNTVEVVKEVVAEVADLSVFEKVELLDDFGDPTGVSYVQARKDFDGAFNTINGVKDGNLKWNIKAQDGMKVIFVIKENGNTAQLSTAYYTSDEYDVKVKFDDNGETKTYKGVIYQGEEGQYNCIMVTSLDAQIYSGRSCKIVISNDRGTYNLGSLDSVGIEELLYDFDSYNEIMEAYETGSYETVISLIERFKNSDEKSLIHFNSELILIQLTAKSKLGIFEVGSLGQAGGYIFYDVDADNGSGNADGLISSECGWRFLEAAPADLRVVNGVPTVDSSVDGYSSAEKKYIFGYYEKSDFGSYLYVNGTTTYSESDCTGESIGQGETNTEKLVEAMGESAYESDYVSTKTENYAARLCSELEHNGYDDWFLPSKGECELMYDNLRVERICSFPGDYYWSSSETNSGYGGAGNAWSKGFMFGLQNINARGGGNYIRPCRTF